MSSSTTKNPANFSDRQPQKSKHPESLRVAVMRAFGVSIEVSESSLPAASPSAPTAMDYSESYLISGVAGISLLISSALSILIISYWQYRVRSIRAERGQRGLEVGERACVGSGAGEGSGKVTPRQKFSVIMAGDENPRFLATPRWYKGFDSGEEEKESLDTVKVKSSDETTSYGEAQTANP